MTLYIRPLGLMRAQSGDALLNLSNAGLVFGLAEIIARREKNIVREIVAARELKNRADKNAELATLLHNLQMPRLPWAGLSLDQPRLMGVLNVTPDSFSDGGRFLECNTAIQHARTMIEQGADIVDVGGESTRPKAILPLLEEELGRVVPVIEKTASSAIVSIDTRRAFVMQKAVQAGARIVNDISALTHDPDALKFVGQNNLPVVLMHMQGTPEIMQDNPHYVHAALDVYDYLEERIAACARAGLARNKIVIDPGIGFGKTLEHNLQILSHLSMFHGLGCGILIGVSRKSFLGKLSGNADAQKRLPGSLAGALYAISQGAQILRVHDVAETKQACTVWQACRD